MPNMTLALDKNTYMKMKKFKHINWSEVSRIAIRNRIRLYESLETELINDTLINKLKGIRFDINGERELNDIIKSLEHKKSCDIKNNNK